MTASGEMLTETMDEDLDAAGLPVGLGQRGVKETDSHGGRPLIRRYQQPVGTAEGCAFAFNTFNRVSNT
jgi:hypothetical protein